LPLASAWVITGPGHHARRQTRLAELFITQDIRRKVMGSTRS